MRGIRYLGIQQMRRVDRYIYSLLMQLTKDGKPTTYQALSDASEYSERHLRRIIRRLENEQVIRTKKVGTSNNYELSNYVQLS